MCPFARPTLRRLHEASGGNPFYALELGRALKRRGGRVELGGPLPVPADLEELLGDHLRALPERVREALLVAAVSSDATPELLESTLGQSTDVQPAIDAKVITLTGGKVRFAHPLFAMAIQQRAGARRTRQMHLRLSQHAQIAEERALHLALGTVGLDECAATALADAARAARGRGAPIAAAAFFEHALRAESTDAARAGRVGDRARRHVFRSR